MNLNHHRLPTRAAHCLFNPTALQYASHVCTLAGLAFKLLALPAAEPMSYASSLAPTAPGLNTLSVPLLALIAPRRLPFPSHSSPRSAASCPSPASLQAPPSSSCYTAPPPLPPHIPPTPPHHHHHQQLKRQQQPLRCHPLPLQPRLGRRGALQRRAASTGWYCALTWRRAYHAATWPYRSRSCASRCRSTTCTPPPPPPPPPHSQPLQPPRPSSRCLLSCRCVATGFALWSRVTSSSPPPVRRWTVTALGTRR